MKIRMIGIDYTTANLDQRELFAFSNAQAEEAMKNIVRDHGVRGCVILSTCNRTELWISEVESSAVDLNAIMLKTKKIGPAAYEKCLIQREEMEAILHLFQTSCGMKSQIWGEDQILAQVKASVEYARLAGTLDEVLEKFFQYAITSAKKIKTEITLNRADASIAARALEIVESDFGSLKGLPSLVIGNGEMGRMISAMLVARGAKVTVTKRQYKSGGCPVPEGCLTILYENRIERIKEAHLIISATRSPHYTLKLCDVRNINDHKDRLFVDLAVPRDIDPAISREDHVRLLNQDDLGISSPAKQNERVTKIAKQIIDEHIAEFIMWDKVRSILPLIDDIVNTTSEKIKYDLSQDIQALIQDQAQRYLLEEKIQYVIKKTMRRILFRLKDLMVGNR